MMVKILATIPHFYARQNRPQRVFGSVTEDAATRACALSRCINELAAFAGADYNYYTYLGGERFARKEVSQVQAPKMDIAVCTYNDQHVLDELESSRHLFRHVHVKTDNPMYLGVGCHNYLLKFIDQYDYFCFLEDDLIIHDPLWFVKYAWFNRRAPKDVLLQPHRFERKRAGRERKCLVDPVFDYAGVETSIGRFFYRYPDRDAIQADFLGQGVTFQRASNPHSGCFFVNREQLRRMAEGPYFGKQSALFIGPLESSATLSIMSSFRVYKPSFEHMGFLEIEHSGERIATEYDGKSAA